MALNAGLATHRIGGTFRSHVGGEQGLRQSAEDSEQWGGDDTRGPSAHTRPRLSRSPVTRGGNLGLRLAMGSSVLLKCMARQQVGWKPRVGGSGPCPPPLTRRVNPDILPSCHGSP